MMEFNDILTRLQNGESAEDLAKEFTKTLTDAEAQVKKEKANLRRLALGKLMIDAIADYVRDVFPELEEDLKEYEDWDDDKYLEALDLLDGTLKILPMMKSLSNIESLFDNPVEESDYVPKTLTSKVELKKTAASDPDFILKSWLKDLGI